MDEALDFGLPSPGERKKILDLYLDKYIAKAGARGGCGSDLYLDIVHRQSRSTGQGGYG